ncbi:MAG: indole-3-glycerol phosphate synthase TrpC [Campylobacteraceae bacterium]
MILDKIIKKTKEDLEKRKRDLPMDLLGRAMSKNSYSPRDVKPYLKSTKENPYRIIAEVKKASPSKGVIREDFDPIFIAQAYEKGGADVLSVLTEPHFFQGNLDYLTGIRRYVQTPLLRKDFIIDEYQVLEAVLYGADMILLIAKALDKNELSSLLDFTRRLGLEALVEIHDKEDLTKAIFAGADIIGVNHRNLETFEMDMDLTRKLMPLIPQNKIIVAESGLNDKETIVELSKVGVDAFLIGEHFMRQDDITSELLKLKEV